MDTTVNDSEPLCLLCGSGLSRGPPARPAVRYFEWVRIFKTARPYQLLGRGMGEPELRFGTWRQPGSGEGYIGEARFGTSKMDCSTQSVILGRYSLGICKMDPRAHNDEIDSATFEVRILAAPMSPTLA